MTTNWAVAAAIAAVDERLLFCDLVPDDLLAALISTDLTKPL